jgi:hypothetical protein
MANNLLTNDLITKTALMEFENNLAMTKTVRTQFEDMFSSSTGRNIRIRKPTRYTAREGRNLQVQAIDQQYTDLTISFLDGVDVEVTSEQFSLELDDFNREVINPAMVTLANKVDSRLYNKSTDIYNFVGTAGTAPSTYATIDLAAAMLDSFGIPRDDRFLMLKTFDASSLRSGLLPNFTPTYNDGLIRQGSLGMLADFDCYSVQNIIRPTFSTAANVGALGTPAINGANQSGSTLTVDGFGASTDTIYAGTTFTIANVFAVNPTSRESTGRLACFVLTDDVVLTGSGSATLPISPAIVLTGPYQNVTNAPADNALITFNATHTKNLAYHQEAFTMATIKLPESNNGVYQRNIRDPKGTGLNIRMSRQYQIGNDTEVIRFDILYGIQCFPEYASVVMGS